MPSQHKATPLSIRLPDGERQRLYERAEREGRPVRQVILSAIRAYLDSEQEGGE